MQLDVSAPQQVLDALTTIGRAKDLHFSPSRRNSAVATSPRAQPFACATQVHATAASKQTLDAISEHSPELLPTPEIAAHMGIFEKLFNRSSRRTGAGA